jgi:chaperonin GroES
MAKAKHGIKPIGDKIIVKRLEAEERTKGGLVIPDTAKEKPKEGRVVTLGAGHMLKTGKLVKFQVKEGDRIIFASYSGTEVKIGGEEFMIMPEDEILAVVVE